jgi:hypothetical protein
MPMQYLNFDIDAFGYEHDAGSERLKVRVADSPAGQQRLSDADQIPFPPDFRARLRRLENRSLDLGEMVGLGQQLAAMLLPDRVRWMLDRCRAMLDPGQGLRIRLRLDSYALSDLPWEYLYVPGPDIPPDQQGPEGFLVLDRRVSLVRYELIGQAAEGLDPVGGGPLRLIALLASPEDPAYPRLDLEAERQNIMKAMAKVSGIEVQFFPGGRVVDLEEALETGAHILHFAGHGEFKTEMGTEFSTEEGKAAIVLVGPHGGAQLFPVEKLAQNLVGRDIRLAVFGACNTARRDRYNAWTGVAPALTRAGIPAVVAMQYTVRDLNAVAFSRRFYGALASGETIDAAVTDGRLAIFNRSDLSGERYERDWGVPVLYLRTPGGMLFPKAGPEAATPPSDRWTVTASPRGEAARPAAVDKRALRSAMISAFSNDELEALCWDAQGLLEEAGIRDVQVSLEMVGGGSKTAIVMNLIEHFDRRGHLDYLVRAVRSARPGKI